MERFKVGINPPPQPRELSSRASALPSRARRFLSIPYNLISTWRGTRPTLEATLEVTAQEVLRPHLDDAVMVSLTQQEFQNKRTSLPQEEKFTGQTITDFILAMGNNVKDERARKIIPEAIKIRRIPEVEELHTLDPVADAYSKAKDAVRIANTREDLRRQVRKGELVTVGVDVITAVPVEENGQMEYKPFGKPQSEEDVFNMFVYMNGVMQRGHLTAYPYITKVATVLHNPFYPNRDAFTVHQAAIVLSPELVATLATPEGFGEYKRLAEESLNKLHHTNANTKTILDTSAGFVVEGFRGMLGGNGIKTVLLDEQDITSHNFSTGTFSEEMYLRAKDIARGSADENLITDYCRRFDVSTPVIEEMPIEAIA